jgi:acyl-CoA synthetase (AMP-forming)/AMP-acid ligase II
MKKGDRVAVFAPSSLEFVISWFSGMLPGLFLIAGAVMVIWGPIIWYYGYKERTREQPYRDKPI